MSGKRYMSYETMYRIVRADRYRGGALWTHVRHVSKPRRIGKGRPATTGGLVGKSHFSERPAEVEARRQVGHCGADTVMGRDPRHCVLALVERVTGFVVIEKLSSRAKEQASKGLARAVIE